ncbi:MAG: HipA domain-containing protein [Gammaproteobacteria bacterium]|nr:HipA domain-containing protein [Gammaproteobacteria bacterium]
MTPDVTVLEVLLHGEPVGTLTRLPDDRSIFAFNEGYIQDAGRPILSLSVKDSFGELITDFRAYKMRVLPFFSNMLPEGQLREYLSDRAGVNPEREFFLLWVLGQDLPGAVTIRPVDGDSLPPDADHHNDQERPDAMEEKILRFSLAGVQLKFSAVMDATGGLTIPARGVGGSWIVKLPSTKFESVPENEFAMMTIACMVGIEVPDTRLVPLSSISRLPEGVENLKGSALAVQRFDRAGDERSIHIEDFAQVFGVYPREKYGKASYRNIAEVLAIETSDEDVAEFVRRLVFNTLIGNADMHLKNWSLIYRDRRNAALAPAYDLVSTIAYIKDDNAGLKYARTRRMDEFTEEELVYLAAKARLPEKLVVDTARETVTRFHEIWAAERKNLELPIHTVDTIDKHIKRLPIAKQAN